MNIAVICNNNHEWGHFKDTLIWHLSKENLPYKVNPLSGKIEDINKGKVYFNIPNYPRGVLYLKGKEWNDYITMAKIVDNDVMEYLMDNMKGE